MDCLAKDNPAATSYEDQRIAHQQGPFLVSDSDSRSPSPPSSPTRRQQPQHSTKSPLYHPSIGIGHDGHDDDDNDHDNNSSTSSNSGFMPSMIPLNSRHTSGGLAAYAVTDARTAASIGDDEAVGSNDDAAAFLSLSLSRRPSSTMMNTHRGDPPALDALPNEILFHILRFLDVNDVLSTSRTSQHLRIVSLAPLLHIYRLRRVREVLPPLLWSPERPSLGNLISRSIFMTNTSVVSRQLARSLVSIRLSRRLAARPSAEALVERAVLPKECVPGMAPVHVSPSILQRGRTIERERIKDGLRRWVEAKWRNEVQEREKRQRRWEESRGIGRVWRLRRFWERISRGEDLAVR
ncbi:FBOX protein [Geosmithia morbida]|uniref:FBOX protein n=1 Tax=Geosmithia morbida TaxID=1094350 RepID=A0A9P4YRW3_9HYPO|nr:FBOX protein [Geosmithia morbida]KAF4121407.1 FBOX protein [Geosmithia morbida]